MKEGHRRVLVAALLAACALPGCSLRYPDAIFDPDGPETRFPGVHSVLNPEQTTRVLWIHGMCHHDAQWAISRMQRFAALLGGTYDAAAFRRPAQVPGTPVEIHAAEISTPRGKAAVQMIVWSPLTVADKRSLCFDNIATDNSINVCGADAPGFPYQRAKLNNTLKTDIMNTCLSDAILYAGQRGQAMREAMTRTICFALGGQLLAGNNCSGADNRADLERAPLVLVAESLGSKLLTDAIFSLRQSAAGRQAIERAFGRTRLIYLFANQIPILDLTSAAEGAARGLAGTEGLRALVEIIRPQGARLDLDDLFVIAFSDPNDMLSYRLPKDYFGSRSDVRVVNVISSNSETIAGFLENPATAHTGYMDNASANAAFICGNREDRAPCPALPALNRGR